MTDPRREDPVHEPPPHHEPRTRSHDGPSRLDEIAKLAEAARVQRTNRPARRDGERSIEQDCSYWIG